jgi:hypothetical protein
MGNIMTRQEIVESEGDDALIFFDGFDDAIIGVAHRIGQDTSVCYDYNKCIEILCNNDDLTEEEAIEHMSYNVEGSYVGEKTPTFLHKPL